MLQWIIVFLSLIVASCATPLTEQEAKELTQCGASLKKVRKNLRAARVKIASKKKKYIITQPRTFSFAGSEKYFFRVNPLERGGVRFWVSQPTPTGELPLPMTRSNRNKLVQFHHILCRTRRLQ